MPQLIHHDLIIKAHFINLYHSRGTNHLYSALRNLMHANQIDITCKYQGVYECNPQFAIVKLMQSWCKY